MNNSPRAKRIIIIALVIFIVGSVASILFFLIKPKDQASKDPNTVVVVIDNYKKYTKYISPASFTRLGSYLPHFITKPTEDTYHATIVDNSYTYAPDSWFSTFIVKLNDNDTSWKVSMQTIKDGSVSGEIKVTCNSGDLCLSAPKENAKKTLQEYLPLSSIDYIIASKKDNPQALSIVYYDQTGTGQSKALEKIKSLGFNPDDYSIEYHYGGH